MDITDNDDERSKTPASALMQKSYSLLHINELIKLKLKQEEKLTRYMRCFNECTERTIQYLNIINEEIKKR